GCPSGRSGLLLSRLRDEPPKPPLLEPPPAEPRDPPGTGLRCPRGAPEGSFSHGVSPRSSSRTVPPVRGTASSSLCRPAGVAAPAPAPPAPASPPARRASRGCPASPAGRAAAASPEEGLCPPGARAAGSQRPAGRRSPTADANSATETVRRVRSRRRRSCGRRGRREGRGGLCPCFGLRMAGPFEEVAVYFSRQEWAELAGWQRRLYREVMLDTYGMLASLVWDQARDHLQAGARRDAVRATPPGRDGGTGALCQAGPGGPLEAWRVPPAGIWGDHPEVNQLGVGEAQKDT
ncbi:sterile alpha motif domain-containing protein 1-like, partial [Cuculus canorus]|uniref:sterile alpha motif domain-containing protein 1-like n=1 Tax=Cuculus canorus TaxID=55661 RepID=UPI0023AABC6A